MVHDEMKRIFKTRTKVRYAETDASGIVYYANYFIYFELGRLAMFEELQLPYDRHLPIADTYCRYHASAKFMDQLEIHSEISEIRRKGFRISHHVYRLEPDGTRRELLVEGYTSMVTADGDGVPIVLPAAFKSALDSCLGDEST